MLYSNILLIDDDLDDGALFVEAVRTLNQEINCRAESNPVHALEKLRESEILPDLIFLDINMPALSGMDFRSRLRDEVRLQNIPVILYSTYSQDAAEQLSLTSGDDQFISKPYSFEALVEILRNIIKP